MTLPINQDLAMNLNALGAAGWETTGIALGTANGTVIVLKRPRP